MKTAEEFFERMQTDEKFAKEFVDALGAKYEAGADNDRKTVVAAAEEYGYEITEEDIDKIVKSSQDTELTEEELGKVAGGTFATFCLITVVTWSVVSAGATYLAAKKAHDKYYPDE